MRWAIWFLAVTMATGPLRADLAAAKAEPNLEKRAAKALDNADAALGEARKAYDGSALEKFAQALGELRESVELCDASLRQTGKNASKSPKHFKRAELKMRDLLRRIEGLRQEVSVDDRPVVEKVKDRVQYLHEELLLDIMGRRR
jgi:hypothetical protein